MKLLYCVDGITKDRNQYRYTQDQRRKETKMKKYRNIQNELKIKKVDNTYFKDPLYNSVFSFIKEDDK